MPSVASERRESAQPVAPFILSPCGLDVLSITRTAYWTVPSTGVLPFGSDVTSVTTAVWSGLELPATRSMSTMSPGSTAATVPTSSMCVGLDVPTNFEAHVAVSGDVESNCESNHVLVAQEG